MHLFLIFILNFCFRSTNENIHLVHEPGITSAQTVSTPNEEQIKQKKALPV